MAKYGPRIDANRLELEFCRQALAEAKADRDALLAAVEATEAAEELNPVMLTCLGKTDFDKKQNAYQEALLHAALLRREAIAKVKGG